MLLMGFENILELKLKIKCIETYRNHTFEIIWEG